MQPGVNLLSPESLGESRGRTQGVTGRTLMVRAAGVDSG